MERPGRMRGTTLMNWGHTRRRSLESTPTLAPFVLGLLFGVASSWGCDMPPESPPPEPALGASAFVSADVDPPGDLARRALSRVSAGCEGLWVGHLDIARPPLEPHGALLADKLLVTAELNVVDISDPAAPTLVGTAPTSCEVIAQAAVDDERLVVRCLTTADSGAWGPSWLLISLADPSHPRVIDRLDERGDRCGERSSPDTHAVLTQRPGGALFTTLARGEGDASGACVRAVFVDGERLVSLESPTPPDGEDWFKETDLVGDAIVGQWNEDGDHDGFGIWTWDEATPPRLRWAPLGALSGGARIAQARVGEMVWLLSSQAADADDVYGSSERDLIVEAYDLRQLLARQPGDDARALAPASRSRRPAWGGVAALAGDRLLVWVPGESDDFTHPRLRSFLLGADGQLAAESSAFSPRDSLARALTLPDRRLALLTRGTEGLRLSVYAPGASQTEPFRLLDEVTLPSEPSLPRAEWITQGLTVIPGASPTSAGWLALPYHLLPPVEAEPLIAHPAGGGYRVWALTRHGLDLRGDVSVAGAHTPGAWLPGARFVDIEQDEIFTYQLRAPSPLAPRLTEGRLALKPDYAAEWPLDDGQVVRVRPYSFRCTRHGWESVYSVELGASDAGDGLRPAAEADIARTAALWRFGDVAWLSDHLSAPPDEIPAADKHSLLWDLSRQERPPRLVQLDGEGPPYRGGDYGRIAYGAPRDWGSWGHGFSGLFETDGWVNASSAVSVGRSVVFLEARSREVVDQRLAAYAAHHTFTARYRDGEPVHTIANFVLHPVDLSDPSAPSFGAPVVLPTTDDAVALLGDGEVAYYLYRRITSGPRGDDRAFVRYFVRELDLSAPRRPRLGDPISIPGVPIGRDGTALIVADFAYRADAPYVIERALSRVELDGARATLVARWRPPGADLLGAQMHGGRVVARSLPRDAGPSTPATVWTLTTGDLSPIAQDPSR